MTDKIMTGGKTKTVYTKSDVVKLVAKDCDKTINEVREILNALEDIVTKTLATADLNTDVCVKLFEGVSIDSMFVPEETKTNNLTGETITVKSKIKPKANITRNYRDKITNYNK